MFNASGPKVQSLSERIFFAWQMRKKCFLARFYASSLRRLGRNIHGLRRWFYSPFVGGVVKKRGHYENGVFKPLRPVNLPERARVRVEAEVQSIDSIEQVQPQLLADGASIEEVDRILTNLQLLWSSYDSLTEDQKLLLEKTRIDRENFFSHSLAP